MPIKFKEENGGKLLAVHLNGKLVAADYKRFVPEFERLVLLIAPPNSTKVRETATS